MLPFLDALNNVVWGPITLWLIGLTGFYLMVGLGFMPLRRIGFGFRQALGSIRSSKGEGDVTAFEGLTTALAATIGTGNVAGVAGAIATGGPGAVFWMWLIAFVGMATKYAESVLAVHYREVDDLGEHVGGPMYFIRNGLGPGWGWLAPCSPCSAPWPASASATACRPMRWPWPSRPPWGCQSCSPAW